MKQFSNVKICVCIGNPVLTYDDHDLWVFRQGAEYPYDFFLDVDGKVMRVFDVNDDGQPTTPYTFTKPEFDKCFLEKSEWNAKYGRNKT